MIIQNCAELTCFSHMKGLIQLFCQFYTNKITIILLYLFHIYCENHSEIVFYKIEINSHIIFHTFFWFLIRFLNVAVFAFFFPIFRFKKWWSLIFILKNILKDNGNKNFYCLQLLSWHTEYLILYLCLSIAFNGLKNLLEMFDIFKHLPAIGKFRVC